MRRLGPILLVCGLVACTDEGPADSQDEAQPKAQPAEEPGPAAAPASDDRYPVSPSVVDARGVERFGAVSPEGSPVVTLQALMSEPEPFVGKRVRTEGVVTRVCQKAGCWVELQDTTAPRLRVPMAGHALAIPQRAIGQRARVEGEVSVRPLTEAQKAHYRAEGMTATEVDVSIAATAVELLADPQGQEPHR